MLHSSDRFSSVYDKEHRSLDWLIVLYREDGSDMIGEAGEALVNA